jgi:hypothetical protein
MIKLGSLVFNRSAKSAWRSCAANMTTPTVSPKDSDWINRVVFDFGAPRPVICGLYLPFNLLKASR